MDDCQTALRAIYRLAPWRQLMAAVAHIASCGESRDCRDVWHGWLEHLRHAARLRAACGEAEAVAPAEALDSCAAARHAVQRVRSEGELCVAAAHLAGCTRGSCVVARLVLFDYLRSLHLVSHPDDSLQTTADVWTRTSAAEP